MWSIISLAHHTGFPCPPCLNTAYNLWINTHFSAINAPAPHTHTHIYKYTHRKAPLVAASYVIQRPGTPPSSPKRDRASTTCVHRCVCVIVTIREREHLSVHCVINNCTVKSLKLNVFQELCACACARMSTE